MFYVPEFVRLGMAILFLGIAALIYYFKVPH
jgi:hypothetical protein